MQVFFTFYFKKNKEREFRDVKLSLFGREEATRTPDPHVPNVVRYQLRYFSMYVSLGVYQFSCLGV